MLAPARVLLLSVQLVLAGILGLVLWLLVTGRLLLGILLPALLSICLCGGPLPAWRALRALVRQLSAFGRWSSLAPVRPWLFQEDPVTLLPATSPASPQYARTLWLAWYNEVRRRYPPIVDVPAEQLLQLERHLARESPSVECYASDVFALPKLQRRLDSIVPLSLSRPELRGALLDGLFGVSFVPVTWSVHSGLLSPFPVTANVSRLAFVPLSISAFCKLLKFLPSDVVWEELSSQGYTRLGLCGRLQLLGTLSYASKVRIRLSAEPLWASAVQLPDAAASAFGRACTSHLEQYYLNTCKTVAYNQSIAAFTPSPVVLLVLAELVCEELQATRGGPRYRYFDGWRALSREAVGRKVASYSKLLAALRARLRAAMLLAQSGDPCAAMAASAGAVHDWNYVMQRMSELYLPRRPVWLTPKPLADDWSTSALLMTALHALSAWLPGWPSLWTRSRGAALCLPALNTFWLAYQPCFPVRGGVPHPVAGLVTELREAAKRGPAGHEAMAAALDGLWERVWARGGALVGCRDRLGPVPVEHLVWLVAVAAPNTPRRRQFVLSDGEYSSALLLEPEQLAHFACNPAYNFDLFDVG